MQMMTLSENDMNENLNKQFYNYLWAYILVALSGCLGNVVDGIIVGNLINEDGVSAIILSKPAPAHQRRCGYAGGLRPG